MEMDYDLLDIDSSEEPSIEETTPTTDVAPSVAEVIAEPVSTVPATEKAASQLPIEPDFDDSTPLTPRERILMERLDRITGDNLTLTAKKPEITAVTPPTATRNFMEGLNIDDVLATPENLNSLLATVYSEAMTEASRLSAEQILQNLPSIISTYVTQHTTMTKLVDDFYSRNPDLKAAMQTVATVANRISAEHPEYTTEQVFETSAVETRNLLRIKGIAPVATTPVKQQKPAFAPIKTGRVREHAPVLSGIEKDVLELIT